MIKKVLAVCGFLTCLGVADSAGATTAELQLLATMKAACGGSAWDRARSWHEKSEAEIKGRPLIQNEVWHNLKSLKSAMTSTVNGRVFRRSGYNGTIAWRVGPDGQTKVISDKDELRRQRRDVYLSSFGWFYPKRFPAVFKIAADTVQDGQTYRVMRITPMDAQSFDIWIDPENYLVRRIVAGSEFAELSEYKTFDGVCTATTGRQGNGAPENDLILRVLDVQTTQPAQAAIFEPPN